MRLVSLLLLHLCLFGLLLASLEDEVLDLSDEALLEIRHAKNLVRMRRHVLKELGMTEDEIPDDASRERLSAMKAIFNDTPLGFAFYNEKQAWNYVSLIGHSPVNTSDAVSFQFGDKVRLSRMEGASLVFYLRHAASTAARKVLFQVGDELNGDIVTAVLRTPNARVKKYTVTLSRDALERAIVASGNSYVITLRITAKVIGDAHDELLILPGRRGYEKHLGILLDMQFPSDEMLSRRRSRRSTEAGELVLRGQCEKGQTTCCPHVQTFSWEDLGIHHIVAPNKFHSIICRGSCEEWLDTDFKQTENRHVLTNHAHPNKCCHPTRFESQQVIWMVSTGKSGKDEVRVESKEIPNFFATRCGCN